MNYNNIKQLSNITLKKDKADIVFKNAVFLNVFSDEWIQADIAVHNNYIVGIGSYEGKQEIDCTNKYIVPGFFDAHLHVESSMARPSTFFQIANQSGTTSFIIDPHEAANVKGIYGIEYMIEEARQIDSNVFVMAPSCVPATKIDDSGAILDASELAKLLKYPEVIGLGEVMDYYAVENFDESMVEKLQLFNSYPKDGHAAGIHSRKLSNYALSGIDTDHEAISFDEALERIRRGMHVHIREGSAAKNLTAIISGIVKHGISTEYCSFCTDDKHIEDMLKHGHIVENVRKSIKLGLNPIQAFKMASINTARCYKLKHLGAIAVGYQADFVVLNDIESVSIDSVYIKGKKVEAVEEKPFLTKYNSLKKTVNFTEITKAQLQYQTQNPAHIIEVVQDEIITKHLIEEVKIENGYFIADSTYNKIAVVERHHQTGLVGVGIIKGFNLKNAAIATSVGHDSHNISVVSDNDDDMLFALETIKSMQGGFVLVSNQKVIAKVELEIMGLMSTTNYEVLQSQLDMMQQACTQYGVSPNLEVFLVLAFASLSVIPELRITTRGLFDVVAQKFV